MIHAFSASHISPEAEALIGQVMLKKATEEGHGKGPGVFGKYIASVEGLRVDGIIAAILDGKTRAQIAEQYGVTQAGLDGFMRRNDLSTRFLLAEKKRREAA